MFDWDDEEYWWYDRKWAVYEEAWSDWYEEWFVVFVGYCYGEFEARWYERQGFLVYLVYEPARSNSW